MATGYTALAERRAVKAD